MTCTIMASALIYYNHASSLFMLQPILPLQGSNICRKRNFEVGQEEDCICHLNSCLTHRRLKTASQHSHGLHFIHQWHWYLWCRIIKISVHYLHHVKVNTLKGIFNNGNGKIGVGTVTPFIIDDNFMILQDKLQNLMLCG